jgi:hypothetical protein
VPNDPGIAPFGSQANFTSGGSVAPVGPTSAQTCQIPPGDQQRFVPAHFGAVPNAPQISPTYAQQAALAPVNPVLQALGGALQPPPQVQGNPFGGPQQQTPNVAPGQPVTDPMQLVQQWAAQMWDDPRITQGRLAELAQEGNAAAGAAFQQMIRPGGGGWSGAGGAEGGGQGEGAQVSSGPERA